jgi:glycosyltransferase involved in cell wall biosynthesis
VKILLVSANFPPRVGGIEQFVATLAAGLARRGHEVDVLCCRYAGAPREEWVDGFAVHRIAASYVLARRYGLSYPLASPGAALALARRHVGRAEIVHLQDAIYPTSTLALLLARRRGVPTVLTQHVAFVRQHHWWVDPAQRAVIGTIGHAARLATVVTAYNDAVAGWARRTWGVEPRVLPVGVREPAAIAENRAALRRSFDLPEERFVALFVGRDVPKKGLDIMLDAADPSYDVVAVSDRSGPAPPGTRLVSFMEPDDLERLMRCVDAFVLPSKDEGFPLVMQMALRAGLPVVTTSLPGYERYLSPEDVLYVDRRPAAIREALRSLASDSTLREALGSRARTVAERHFTADAFVSAYERLYEEVVERRRFSPTRS